MPNNQEKIVFWQSGRKLNINVLNLNNIVVNWVLLATNQDAHLTKATDIFN